MQSQQEVLKCTLAAQDQLETIRREYGTVRSLVQQIQELQPDKPRTRSQMKFVDELIRQKQSVKFLCSVAHGFCGVMPSHSDGDHIGVEP